MRAGTGFGIFTVTIASSLADGVHSYRFEFRIGGSDKPGTRTTWHDGFFHTSPFNITYIKSKVTITTPEVPAATAASGHKLGTLTLSQEVPGATWTVEGTPAVQVNLTPVVGSENEQVEVALAEAAALKSASPDFLTLTLSAVSDVGTATTVSVSQAYTELKVEVGAGGPASDGISADGSALAELGADSKSDTIPVWLLTQPAGGQNVTLSVTSVTPAELTVAPAHLVFTPSDWSTAQTVTVGVTDDFVAGPRIRKNIDVVFSVHDAGNSATNYQSVAAATVSVPVNNNAGLMFDPGSLRATIDENAEGFGNETQPGTVVGTVQATDASGSITYSILTGADGFLFEIDSSTGVISLNVVEDFDHDGSQNMYTISVRAQDETANTSARFVLSVRDVPEPPTPANFQANLIKNAILGRARNNVTLACICRSGWGECYVYGAQQAGVADACRQQCGQYRPDSARGQAFIDDTGVGWRRYNHSAGSGGGAETAEPDAMAADGRQAGDRDCQPVLHGG